MASTVRTVLSDLVVPFGSIAIRTCYEQDEVWHRLLQAWGTPNADGFKAHLSPVEDPRLDGLTPQEALQSLPAVTSSVVVIADRLALEDPDHPALVVDPATGGTFRVIPKEMWSVENNLSLANLDFADFASAAGPDGVFRGFDGPASSSAPFAEPRYTVELRWPGLTPPAGVRAEDYALTQRPAGVTVMTTCEFDSLVLGRVDSGAGMNCRHAADSARLTECPRCVGPCRGHAFCPPHLEQVRSVV